MQTQLAKLLALQKIIETANKGQTLEALEKKAESELAHKL